MLAWVGDMASDIEEKDKKEKPVPFLSPGPERRRRLVELIYAFLEDKVSLAELRGISREKLFLLAEAGYVKFKHGRVDEAERIYQSLILLDHRNPYYHAVMGAIHQKKGRVVEAILEYTRAVSLDQNDISSYVNRGEIYLRHRNFRKAAEDFRQAILLDKSGKNMWANRARSLVIALKRLIDAEKEKKALEEKEKAEARRELEAGGEVGVEKEVGAKGVRKGVEISSASQKAMIDEAAREAGRSATREATPPPPSPSTIRAAGRAVNTPLARGGATSPSQNRSPAQNRPPASPASPASQTSQASPRGGMPTRGKK